MSLWHSTASTNVTRGERVLLSQIIASGSEIGAVFLYLRPGNRLIASHPFFLSHRP
jgi:hypothetical protein